VSLLNTSDPKTGTAACNWTANIGGDSGVYYDIGILVNGYYIRNSSTDDVMVAVSKPVSNFISAGGLLVNLKSGGTYAGDAGARTNFGLNIMFNKTLTNLQGKATIIVRQGGHVYQIKTNVLSSLVVVPYDPKKPGSGTAELLAKANIVDVTDPLNPVSITSSAIIQIVMKDNGEPGSSDTISFSVWSKTGQLLFSNNWNGVKTIPQVLSGGNLQIH
jgi:hypothetical protein